MSQNKSKEECWEFNEKIDIGIILEQGWMFADLINKFKDGRLLYCFLIDKDLYILEKNKKKYLFTSSNGASIVACRAEEMIKWGAKEIYRIGTCGALQNDIKLGDVILTLASIKDEGTSRQYLPEIFPCVANFELLLKFQKKLRNKNLPVHIGITWTTDGRFIETDEKIKSFANFNVKSVDMETSAFLSVCLFRKVHGISVSIVTDKPFEDLGSNFKGKIFDLPKTKEVVCNRLTDIISAILE